MTTQLLHQGRQGRKRDYLFLATGVILVQPDWERGGQGMRVEGGQRCPTKVMLQCSKVLAEPHPGKFSAITLIQYIINNIYIFFFGGAHKEVLLVNLLNVLLQDLGCACKNLMPACDFQVATVFPEVLYFEAILNIRQ